MNFSFKHTYVGATLVMAFAIVTAHAQQSGVGGAVTPSSPIERVQPERAPVVVPPVVPQPPTEGAAQAGPPIHVSSVEIEGATVYSTEELMALLRNFEGRDVPTREIVEAVRNIQNKYRNDGYFLTVARGVLEPVAGGARLRVQITEGYISSVKLDGTAGPVDALIYDFLKHLVGVRPARLADVERYALLAQNLPGVTLQVILRPTKDEPGAVELVAKVSRQEFDAFFSDDNRGPHYAGPDEMLIGASANSFTSFGERTEVLLYDTPFNTEQIFGQASVEGFVGSEGLKLRAYGGYGTAFPGDVLALVGFKGLTALAGLSATYPVIRTRPLSLFVVGSFDISNNDISLLGPNGQYQTASTDNLRMIRVGESLDVQDDILGPGMAAANDVTFTLHHGLPVLGATDNSAALPARPGENSDFFKMTTELVRVQDLAAWDKYSLAVKLAFAGQYTPDILPPTEKFFLGGNQYGRGFYSGEVTGDNVAAGTVELQVNDTYKAMLFDEEFDIGLQYYGFFDIGQTWENAPGDINQHVESTGIGIRANLTSRISAQVEGVNRFTRRPTAEFGSRETAQAVFFRIVARY